MLGCTLNTAFCVFSISSGELSGLSPFFSGVCAVILFLRAGNVPCHHLPRVGITLLPAPHPVEYDGKTRLRKEEGETMAKILTVDDAAFMRNIIKNTLGKVGYTEIYEAADGIQAIQSYKQINPDLVLLDITMPNLDGLNTLRAIRTIDPHAKVVMCTAMGQESMVLEAMQYGAKDFIVKPFKAERLVRTVTVIVGEP